MSAYVIWIDQEHAKLFQLTPQGPEKKEIRKKVVKHHTKGDLDKNQGVEHFYHEVSQSLGSATELLIVGPGVAKNHFKNHLETHHHKGLAGKVVGVESMDHPTDNQILAAARKFFKVYDSIH